MSFHLGDDSDEETRQVQQQRLVDLLVAYQQPEQADTLARTQGQLNEISDIMQRNIADILERGTSIEQLAARSNDLTIASKAFHAAARKQNACCWLF
jgi:synaptobrevin family protein YKT6